MVKTGSNPAPNIEDQACQVEINETNYQLPWAGTISSITNAVVKSLANTRLLTSQEAAEMDRDIIFLRYGKET